MFKKLLITMALVLCFTNVVDAQMARSRGYTHHQVSIVDMTGNPITDISTVSIYLPGTTTDMTIYSDGNLANAITLPMTTVSANTTLNQAKGTFSFWGAELFDFSVGNGSVNVSNAFTNAFNSSKQQIVFPYFLRTYDSQSLLDAQSITYGTDSDWVQNGGNVADSLVFTPATADTSIFSVGTTNFPSDLKVWGATSGYDVFWDASNNSWIWTDDAIFAIGTGSDYTITHSAGTTTIAGAYSVAAIPTFETDVIFDGATDIKYDDSRAQLHFQDSSVLGIGGAADAAGDIVIVYTGGTDVMNIGQSVADTGSITVGADGAGIDWTFFGEEAGDYMKWDGTGASSLLLVGADSSGTLIAVTGIDTTGNSDSVTINHSGTGAALKMTSSEADTQLLELVSAANQTTWLSVIDGATGNWIGADDVGMLHLKADTALAHAGSSQLMIVNTAQPISAAQGFALRVVDTGTATTDAYAVKIETTDTTGGLLVDSFGTFEKGVQVLSQSVTSTADGLTTGLIPDHASFVTVTSDTATKVVVLPTWVIGHVIRITVPSTGAELQTLASSNDTINAVDCDGTNEMAMAATSIYHLECVADSTWIAYAWGADGAAEATIVPDAD